MIKFGCFLFHKLCGVFLTRNKFILAGEWGNAIFIDLLAEYLVLHRKAIRQRQWEVQRENKQVEVNIY